MGAAGLMTQYQGVGLGAVDQAHGHAGKRGMEQRALTLDHVPMIGVVGRGQRLDRAGDEVGHDGVDRHPFAGDENTGLAGGTKIGLHAAAVHFSLYRQSGEHFTDRAIGADRQQPLTRPFNAVANIEILGWMANVEQLSAVVCGGLAGAGISVILTCRPLAMSMPSSSARTSSSTQRSGITPPRLATPRMTV